MSTFIEVRPQVNLVIAYLLWFFFGFFGVHKFYLKQPIKGVLYLLAFFIGIATTQVLVGFAILGLLTVAWLFDMALMPLRAARLNTYAV